MKIIESSDPSKVEASNVRWMLTERVAMTTAVCNELDGGDSFGNERAKVLLGRLRGWIRDLLDSKSAWPDEGLDELEVPADAAVEFVSVDDLANIIEAATGAGRSVGPFPSRCSLSVDIGAATFRSASRHRGPS